MKTKNTSKYVCQECGSVSPTWIGKCSYCGKFGTIVEEIIEETTSFNGVNSSKNKPTPISQIQPELYDRISTKIPELDNVLGGGIVPNSIVLIGGDPGIGKSTILTQVCGNILNSQKVLYVSAEESLNQVKLRCDRLKISASNFLILNENCLDNIEKVIDDFDFIVIDSIQTVYLSSLSGSAGSVGQVRECATKLMHLAKTKQKTIFLIGHVTKDGAIAGPKVLEHIMDTVLYFEGEPSDNLKILRAVKNRFGSAQEVGVFEMTENGIFGVKDYNGIFLSDNRGSASGSVATITVSGNRSMPVEIQSLISKTVFGLPRRMPLGIDYNKLILIIAVLERKAYIPFYNQDVYVNAMSGIKLNEPAVDLAIALSLVSSIKNQPIDKNLTVFGELGLTGEIRPVIQAEKRVLDAIKYGFRKIIIPKANYNSVKKYSDKIEILPVSYVSHAVKLLFNNDEQNIEN